VPLHHMSQGERRTIHCERDLAGRQRNGRGRDGEWEGRNGCAAFLPFFSCGSALFGVADGTGEIKIRLGAFDQAPTYELWSVRRERWMPALPDAEQFAGNRSMLGSAARLLSRSPIAMPSSACGSEGSRLAICAPPSRAGLWLASMTSAQAYETTNATIMATIASVREIPSTQRTTPVVRPCRTSVAVFTGGGRSDIAAIPLLR
jgi:hypothetical protein